VTVVRFAVKHQKTYFSVSYNIYLILTHSDKTRWPILVQLKTQT